MTDMEKTVNILSHFIKHLKTQSEPIKGDLSGITTQDGRTYILSGYIKSHQMPHDPGLLLPLPVSNIGSFSVTKGDFKLPSLTPGELFISWDQDELTVYVGSENESNKIEYKEISENKLLSSFTLARICFSLDLTTRDKTADVKSVINEWSHKVLSSSCCFKLRDSKLLLQNHSERNIVSLDPSMNTKCKRVEDLAKALNKKKHSGYMYDNILTFDMFINKSEGGSLNSPVVHFDNRKFNLIATQFVGEALVYVDNDLYIEKVPKLLSASVNQSLQLAEYWQIKQLTDKKFIGNLECYNSVSYIVGHAMNVVYPSCTIDDDLINYRKIIHNTFMWSTTEPIIRKSNKVIFPADKSSQLLQNTHLGLKPSGVNGEVSIVKGVYNYHHYMQNNFDDNKWGCAYRSLQTLVSWFKWQGYTTKSIPTHREIQQSLVDVGDKPKSFVGSCQWIGSTEVGYVLDNLFGISCRYIFVNSGDELAYKGRELAMHFKTQGTPIMVGGGVLAHTIIGVNFSPLTGDTNFLILDPHYTGGEDLSVIQKQGWCGWKKPNFWKSDAYYNLCLPLRPSFI